MLFSQNLLDTLQPLTPLQRASRAAAVAAARATHVARKNLEPADACLGSADVCSCAASSCGEDA